MEGLKQGLRSLSKDKELTSSLSSSNRAFAGPTYSGDQSAVLVTRAPRQVVSLWTCSKLCALGFAVGVVVGFTLKQRLRRWAARILRRMKDD
ncbi:uncharacterized protein LOC122060456 [Macadamia integrifolia]|uniref:uncharacterized protein LOC122060456 n=1 Tax=Macadamia integrifolia TaxID=60698 RepID=UPI001C52A1B4|nr:uncharacterized protein LOC122060456 [Macadamia integrifolia]